MLELPKQNKSQLTQANKMAALGQLLSSVAHEINNPLTGVLNNVQLIRMLIEQKQEFNLNDFKELLDVIEECAQRCTKITHSLLDFSRASRGAFQPVLLNEAVEKVTDLIEQELKLQDILLEKELQPGIPLISGDLQLLEQVIFDIISNACWAIKQKGEKEGGTIRINIAYLPQNKCVVLCISDTGIGIAKENLERIFEAFFTTKGPGEGTGLGLSIAHNIIKEHRGDIKVESEVGKGTTFKISLPVIL